MSKYIDAEKLIEVLEELKKAEYENCGGVNAKTGVLQEVQELIASLHQERPEVDMKFDELEQKIRHYRWLKDIAESYQDMVHLIERERDNFTINAFSYSARGDGTVFQVNPHRTIPYKYILDGLKAELETINAEITECEKDLQGWI